ncbi:MAG: glycerol-3-phosphate 1-O-acyltransferase PlsY [Lachnospiraceae bacterium]|nr:glycerol-3-phosphate 1-O-acyltransferase PlsY [Lachnospiraceae bacterium]
MFRVYCLLIGYIFGLIQTAFVIGKINGIDIREHGSGNAGTTNTMRVLGRKAGLLVFLGDCLKCVIAILLCLFIMKKLIPDYENFRYLIKLYTGMGCILGHNFPFYMQFKGGKGIACTAGLMFTFDPWFVLVGFIVFFSTFFITHYVSLGSLFVYPYIFIMELILGNDYFKCDKATFIEMLIITAVLFALTTFMHRSNIKRLLTHSEKKTYLTKKSEI